MAEEDENFHAVCNNTESERQADDDYPEQENRSDHGEEELNDSELEIIRKELLSEVAELEWEFKQAKETLYNERILQVENKLSQARSGTAPEFLHVVTLVEETYKVRLQVAKHRLNFALELANKELDNELQVALCNVNERLLTAEEQIRLGLQEALCRLQVERSTIGIHSSDENYSNVNEHCSFVGQNDLYLPSPNLEPRKKPVTLSPSAPRLVYQLPEEEIRADVETILAAVKKHKLAFALAEMNGGKQVF